MKNKANFQFLFQASRNQLVSFDSIPPAPVRVKNIHSFLETDLTQIIMRYNHFGFCIVQLESEQINSETILSLGKILNLGDAFIPPLYSQGDYKASSVSKISTRDDAKSHPTFQYEVEVKWHCDGTLQEIGYVKTSILLCESPGAEGGDSILFNATAAFAELLSLDVDAAIALATPGSLIRQANMNGCSDKNVGSVFSVRDRKLVTAYSITETDRFAVGQDINPDDLRRGVSFMHKASQPGSAYYHQLRLEASQAIIFANSKISHGRTSYKNTPTSRRCLYRSIFLEEPSIVLEKSLQKVG